MSIVSSQIVSDWMQVNGSRIVHELHIDNVGAQYDFIYLAPNAAWNTATVLAARAITLAADIVSHEILININSVSTIGSLAVPTFVYSTVAQNVAALRAAYLVSTRTQA